MENLNAEQIIKALECLTGEPKLCKGCPYDGTEHYPFCREHCAKDALDLINSQEQRIKELTEENERLTEELAKAYKALDEVGNFYCSFTKSKIQNCPIDDEVAKAKADTVRKMQERIEKYYSQPKYQPTKEHPIKHTQIEHLFAVIDQIAKEMLEGEK